MLDSKYTHVTTHRASMIERRRAPTSKSICCGKQVGGVVASKSGVGYVSDATDDWTKTNLWGARNVNRGKRD
jgi:hypothetical protein